MTRRVDEAAKRFFAALLPNEPHGFDNTDHKAKPLVRAAFALYAAEWPGEDIRRWEFPFAVLTGAQGVSFEGDQPWTVLLRRACELAAPK